MIYPEIENPQISTKILHNSVFTTVSKVVFLFTRFLLCTYKCYLKHYTVCYICKEKKYVFADLRKFLIRNSQKNWVRKF
jgi:hypothetical protein